MSASSLADARSRRREIDGRLESAGFLRTPVLEPPPWPDPGRNRRVKRLCSELEALGPVLSRLGRYLSTRIDHLPAEDCRTLAALPDRAAPMGEGEVRGRLRAELGQAGLSMLAHLEGVPAESALASQTHHARLADGRRVTIRLSRSGLLEGPDLNLVSGLAPRLSNLGWRFAAVERILSDFRELVKRELDLRRTAAVLEGLGSEAPGRLFGAPPVVPELSSAGVLTLENPSLAPLLPDPPPGSDPDPETLGRTRGVADLWMHLVFARLRVPEELSPKDVRLGPGAIVQLVGGLFQPIPEDEARGLWRYLGAAARDDTEGVYGALLDLSQSRNGAQPEAFRHQLDHLVPRRDGRFGEDPPGLPELLLSHWRELERHGLSPNPSLLAAYRGLVRLRELTGGGLSHEVLRESLQVAQITRGAEHLLEASRPSQLLRSAEAWLDWLGDLRRRLGGVRIAEPGEARGEGRGWLALAAGLLLLGSFWIWFERLPRLFGGFTAGVEACAVALTGLLLLRAIWRA